ncbi:methyltransferase-like protein 27 [Vombatus ursinus]|uniref:methyltransferase-like protein 27 n=1 Tax=Vombatus ursinus TaxID=29139 RepID=UPI000FFD52C9|nr:methyltransferase-like protein 27 [Vombatus ursinus]
MFRAQDPQILPLLPLTHRKKPLPGSPTPAPDQLAGPGKRKTASPRRSLSRVRDWIGTSHSITNLSQKISFDDQWASDYDTGVAILDRRAPCLAVGCLASALPSPPQESLLLDVAGFCTLHGVEGSQSMLELAKRQGLCQQLSLCILGPEALPAPSDHYDAVMVVGTLSDGQVPYSAVSELLPSLSQHGAPIPDLKQNPPVPGGLVCLTTRVNSSNLPYAELARLEQAGEWKQILVHTEDWWKWVTSEKEATGSVSSNCGFIPGVIYLYYKQEATPANAIGV